LHRFYRANFFARAVSKYAIATDLQPQKRRMGAIESEFLQKRTEGAESEAEKVVNIFFKFLFPPTTTTKPKRHENARRVFRAEQADEKGGRISAACAQARAVFAASDAIERSNYEHD
jgi:hypothetical protein